MYVYIVVVLICEYFINFNHVRINEKIEGVGSGEGLCPPQLGAWGLPPEKKNNFALKIMQF